MKSNGKTMDFHDNTLELYRNFRKQVTTNPVIFPLKISIKTHGSSTIFSRDLVNKNIGSSELLRTIIGLKYYSHNLYKREMDMVYDQLSM